MPDNSGDGVLIIGQDRAAQQAGRFDTVMAGGGDGLLQGDDRLARYSRGVALEEPDLAPAFVVIQAVEGVAGGDAAFASRAPVEVHFEGVLFPGPGCLERDQVTIMRRERRFGMLRMPLREFLDGGQLPLCGNQLVHQRHHRVLDEG